MDGEDIRRGDGWLVLRLEYMTAIHLSIGEMTDASFEAYLVALDGMLESADPDAPIGLLLEVDSRSPFISATRRRQIAGVMNRRGAAFSTCITAGVFVSTSPIARGIMTAIGWLASIPFQSTVTGDCRVGFEWLAERCPELSAEIALERYQTALTQRLPRGTACE